MAGYATIKNFSFSFAVKDRAIACSSPDARCQHKCTDLASGGHYCSCFPGYQSDPNNATACIGGLTSLLKAADATQFSSPVIGLRLGMFRVLN